LVSPGAATDGVTYFAWKNDDLFAVVSSPLPPSGIVYPVFFLNSATKKINFIRVSPSGWCHPGRPAPSSDATVRYTITHHIFSAGWVYFESLWTLCSRVDICGPCPLSVHGASRYTAAISHSVWHVALIVRRTAAPRDACLIDSFDLVAIAHESFQFIASARRNDSHTDLTFPNFWNFLTHCEPSSNFQAPSEKNTQCAHY